MTLVVFGNCSVKTYKQVMQHRLFYEITTPSGKKLNPPAGRCWLYTKEKFLELVADNRIYFGTDGSNAPRLKKFLSESENAGLTPETIWNILMMWT